MKTHVGTVLVYVYVCVCVYIAEILIMISCLLQTLTTFSLNISTRALQDDQVQPLHTHQDIKLLLYPAPAW